MRDHIITYLNPAGGDGAHMSGKLIPAFRALPAKLQKAPPAQWAASFKSLTQKGVKQVEIDDSGILPWLLQSTERSLQREDVEKALVERSVTIKEIELADKPFQGHSHMSQVPKNKNPVYRVLLFVANSRRDNIVDAIDEIDWQLENLALDVEAISLNPMKAIELEGERARLLSEKMVAFDFPHHHFSQQFAKDPSLGKNLLAHARVIEWDGHMLIGEIQSDWAQRGRANNWATIPKGPFVTETQIWAGMVLRRLLQRAALDPRIQHVHWIRGWMRNGGGVNGGGANTQRDGLDEFYTGAVASLADKALAGSGVRSSVGALELNETTRLLDLPGFEMTPAAREVLSKSQSLYSMACVGPARDADSIKKLQAQLKSRAHAMLGSHKHLRLATHVFDIATGREVAGSYMNSMLQVSLNARDPLLALNHEAMHFALERIYSRREREVILAAFEPRSPLVAQIKATLRRSGDAMAARQCEHSAEEAAAHGFALWCQGKLEMEPLPQAQGMFQDLRALFLEAVAWLRRVAGDHKAHTPEELFAALDSGQLAPFAPAPARFHAPDVPRPRMVV